MKILPIFLLIFNIECFSVFDFDLLTRSMYTSYYLNISNPIFKAVDYTSVYLHIHLNPSAFDSISNEFIDCQQYTSKGVIIYPVKLYICSVFNSTVIRLGFQEAVLTDNVLIKVKYIKNPSQISASSNIPDLINYVLQNRTDGTVITQEQMIIARNYTEPQLQSCSLTFSPQTPSQLGIATMSLKVIPSISFPVPSSMILMFPSYWSDETMKTNHPISVNQTQTCLDALATGPGALLNCSSTPSYELGIQYVNQYVFPTYTQVLITINNTFSPPTTSTNEGILFSIGYRLNSSNQHFILQSSVQTGFCRVSGIQSVPFSYLSLNTLSNLPLQIGRFETIGFTFQTSLGVGAGDILTLKLYGVDTLMNEMSLLATGQTMNCSYYQDSLTIINTTCQLKQWLYVAPNNSSNISITHFAFSLPYAKTEKITIPAIFSGRPKTTGTTKATLTLKRNSFYYIEDQVNITSRSYTGPLTLSMTHKYSALNGRHILNISLSMEISVKLLGAAQVLVSSWFQNLTYRYTVTAYKNYGSITLISTTNYSQKVEFNFKSLHNYSTSNSSFQFDYLKVELEQFTVNPNPYPLSSNDQFWIKIYQFSDTNNSTPLVISQKILTTEIMDYGNVTSSGAYNQKQIIIGAVVGAGGLGILGGVFFVFYKFYMRKRIFRKPHEVPSQSNFQFVD